MPVEEVHRVKDRENEKAEKNEKERSKVKKSERFSKKKYILYIFTWKLHQNLPSLSESAFLAN